MAVTDATELTSGEELLSKADIYLFKLESLFNFFAGAVIFFTMMIGVVQVVGRSVFNWPVPAYVDIIEITMAVFAFLGIAYCQRLGGHVRMEIVLKQFRGRSLWIAEVIGILISMFIIGVLVVYGYDHFLRAYINGDSTIDGDFVVWPSKLVVPVAFFVLMCRFTLNLIGYIRLVQKPNAVPIAVPVMESVDELADHEIRTSGLGDEAVSDRSLRRQGAE